MGRLEAVVTTRTCGSPEATEWLTTRVAVCVPVRACGVGVGESNVPNDGDGISRTLWLGLEGSMDTLGKGFVTVETGNGDNGVQGSTGVVGVPGVPGVVGMLVSVKHD